MDTPEQTEPTEVGADLAPITVSGTFVRRIELPSGGWAEFRDPKELRNKDRRKVLGNIKDPDQRVLMSLDVLDGLVCMLVDKWEVPYLPGAPLPRDVPGILGELEIPDADALTEAAGAAREVIFPTPATPSQAATPGSPTRPAGA